MTKTKVKNDLASANAPQRGFLTAWVISHIAFWLVMWLPLDVRQNLLYYWGRNTADGSSPVIILFTTLVMALLQGRIIQRVFNQSIRGWVLASMIGALLSIGTFATIPSSNLYVWVLSLLLPIAIVQTIWLWRFVKAAWLWLAASVVGALFFAFPLSNPDIPMLSEEVMPWMIVIGLSQGIIQAVVMRHLWLHTEEMEKTKQPPLASEEEDDLEAVERLSLRVNDSAEDIIDKDSLSKQQTS